MKGLDDKLGRRNGVKLSTNLTLGANRPPG